MKKSILILGAVVLVCQACNSSINKIFGKKTPHEAYADKVKNEPDGIEWLAASKRALQSPQAIGLPYRLMGHFHAGRERALALQFSAKQGERINFDLAKKFGAASVIYADLFRLDGAETTHILSADTALNVFGFDVEESGKYILRLQPELYRTIQYDLSASIGPSLGFPVAGNKARMGSFWGDERDGGRRKHEGIDIFASKLTPAIASSDGYVTRVANGGIGGKTVWVNVKDADIYLYYAHLDKQLVSEGQSVKAGDTLGLVGNTGNAKYTPPHLHFGVYTSRGPIDPFPYVNKEVKTAPALKPIDPAHLLKLKKSLTTGAGKLIEKGDTLVPLAITSEGYIAELPDGNFIQAPLKSATVIKPAKPAGNLANDKLPQRGDGG